MWLVQRDPGLKQKKMRWQPSVLPTMLQAHTQANDYVEFQFPKPYVVRGMKIKLQHGFADDRVNTVAEPSSPL